MNPLISARYWLADRLLALVRVVHPPRRDGRPKARVWQIIEVPRRLSKTEADNIATQIKDL